MPSFVYFAEGSSMGGNASTLDEVKDLVAEALGIEDRAGSMGAGTRLLGELPELDSLGVVMILTEIENRFGFLVRGPGFSRDGFGDLGRLAGVFDEERA